MPSLGNPASTLTVSGGATLQFNSISSTMNKALVLQDGAIVNNTAGASTYGGPVTLQGTGIFQHRRLFSDLHQCPRWTGRVDPKSPAQAR